MPGKQVTPMQAVIKYLNDQIEKRNKILLKIVSYTGEAGLIVARLNGTYTDRTGNLRSSIGYAIIRNGKVLDIIIYEADKGTDKTNGVREGKKLLNDIAQKFNNGISLVMAAGMKYAEYVSDKGYDVLDSSKAEVKRLFLRLLREAGFIVK